jgi:hypothetical protein
VTIPRLPGRDADAVDALVADQYLDELLAGGGRGEEPGPGGADPADPPSGAALAEPTPGREPLTLPAPAIRNAADVLRRSLVRVHPSFRFEERLAARLADLAASQAQPALAAAGGGTIIRFPVPGRTADGVPEPDPLLDAILRGDLDPTDAAALDRAAGVSVDRRPLIVGGAALTSAAISIVGVAIVAWRASRPASRRGTVRAMGRAARTAHARRVAASPADISGSA